MKIALVSQPTNDVHLPPRRYGSIRVWNYEVARRLARSCNVTIYARRSRFQETVEWHEGVQYRRVSASPDHVLMKFLNPFSRLRRVKSPFFASRLYYLGYILQIAKDLREQRYDIVHLHNFSQFVPVIRSFNPDTKIVVHMHAEWLTQLNRAMIAQRIKYASLIVGCSEYIAGSIRDRFPEHAERCKSIYNGVDVDVFYRKNGYKKSQKDEMRRLLFVGRISPEKGLHVLLDSFQEVLKHYPQVQVEIIGPYSRTPREFLLDLSNEPNRAHLEPFYHGTYLAHLQQRLPLKIRDRVVFTGFIPHGELVDHYRQADLLINPSLSESFGMSLIEAMACQVPVVATRIGGMVDIIEEGITGLLVKPGDALALSEAILHLLTNEELRHAMGKAGRQQAVRRFSWDQIVVDLLSHYETLYKRE